jgi:hypothetical protein
MYSAWIKIDERLPWIELEGAFQTRAEAQKAAKEMVGKVKIKLFKLPKQETKSKATAIVRH